MEADLDLDVVVVAMEADLDLDVVVVAVVALVVTFQMMTTHCLLPAPPANQNSFEGDSGNPSERRGYGAPCGPYRVGGDHRRRGGFSNGEAGEEGRPCRTFDRHSGTGQGGEFKCEGAGRGNWGAQNDEIAQNLNKQKVKLKALISEGKNRAK